MIEIVNRQRKFPIAAARWETFAAQALKGLAGKERGCNGGVCFRPRNGRTQSSLARQARNY